MSSLSRRPAARLGYSLRGPRVSVLQVAPLALVVAGLSSPALASADAQPHIDRMLAALGGREAIADLRSLRVKAECTGPGGALKTRLDSFRPDSVYLHQQGSEGILEVGAPPSVPGSSPRHEARRIYPQRFVRSRRVTNSTWLCSTSSVALRITACERSPSRRAAVGGLTWRTRAMAPGNPETVGPFPASRTTEAPGAEDRRSGLGPFVVCGGRRTGTTLTAAILCSDQHVAPLGQEAQILTRLVEAYRWGRVHFDDFERSFFGEQEILRQLFAESVANLLAGVSRRVHNGKALVLKNPELSLVLTDVVRLLPRAVVVATVRDPRDQVASELEVGARRLNEGIPDPISEGRDVHSLAERYKAYLAEVLPLRDSGTIQVVRYEDLVERSHSVLDLLRRLTGLDLPFEPRARWPRVSPLAALHQGPSRSNLYGGPITNRSVGRFRRDLRPEEIRVVERATRDLMRALGYQPKIAKA